VVTGNFFLCSSAHLKGLVNVLTRGPSSEEVDKSKARIRPSQGETPSRIHGGDEERDLVSKTSQTRRLRRVFFAQHRYLKHIVDFVVENIGEVSLRHGVDMMRRERLEGELKRQRKAYESKEQDLKKTMDSLSEKLIFSAKKSAVAHAKASIRPTILGLAPSRADLHTTQGVVEVAIGIAEDMTKDYIRTKIAQRVQVALAPHRNLLRKSNLSVTPDSITEQRVTKDNVPGRGSKKHVEVISLPSSTSLPARPNGIGKFARQNGFAESHVLLPGVRFCVREISIVHSPDELRSGTKGQYSSVAHPKFETIT